MLTLIVWVALAGPALSAEPASELQPNLEALPADEFRLETDADGRTYLRFSTTTWNIIFEALSLVKRAVQEGKIRKSRGALFVAIVKRACAERGVMVGASPIGVK